jgi:hypothetical protein
MSLDLLMLLGHAGAVSLFEPSEERNPRFASFWKNSVCGEGMHGSVERHVFWFLVMPLGHDQQLVCGLLPYQFRRRPHAAWAAKMIESAIPRMP